MSRGHIISKPVIGFGVGEIKVSKARSYDGGNKYCSNCAAYYLTDSNRCPNCRTLLRGSPRRRKHMTLKRINSLQKSSMRQTRSKSR